MSLLQNLGSFCLRFLDQRVSLSLGLLNDLSWALSAEVELFRFLGLVLDVSSLHLDVLNRHLRHVINRNSRLIIHSCQLLLQFLQNTLLFQLLLLLSTNRSLDFLGQL